MLIYWRVSLVYHTVPPLLQGLQQGPGHHRRGARRSASQGRTEQNAGVKEDLDGC